MRQELQQDYQLSISILLSIQIICAISLTYMGCAQSNQISDISSPLSLESLVGVLRITVTTCNITSYDSMMSTIDPYIIVQLSNQIFRTNILKGVSKTGQIKWNQSHEFIINKARTIFGRVLEVQVWDQYRLGQSQIGFGTLDLDPLVKANIQNMTSNSHTPTPSNKPVSQHEYKCWLNCKNNPTGYVNFTCSFQELPHEVLHFRFESAIIRKKTRLIGNMNCRVKVTLGQQQLSTSFCPDTKQRPPTWLGQIDILKIKYPVVKTLLDCRIGLYDENQLIGEISVNIHEVQALNKGVEKEFMQDMFLNQQQTASMRYSIVRGDNPKFEKKDLVGTKVIKRKDQQKKQQPKKNQPANKEQPKKDQPHKKEELKKQEPKKEQPKKQDQKQEPKKEEPKKQDAKQEPKKEEPKKEQPKKEEPKKQEPKKQEPKKENLKEEPKNEEPKKQDPKQGLKKEEPKKQDLKEEPQKEEPKKQQLKKEQPKKQDPQQEPKKEEPKKEQPKKEDPKQEPIKQDQKSQPQQNSSDPIKQANTTPNNPTQSHSTQENNKQKQNNLNDESKQRLKQNESELNKIPINDKNKISQQNNKQDQHKESNPIV